jgi:hypothetical protein
MTFCELAAVPHTWLPSLRGRQGSELSSKPSTGVLCLRRVSNASHKMSRPVRTRENIVEVGQPRRISDGC